jgi:arylsulfatase A-like enzyme
MPASMGWTALWLPLLLGMVGCWPGEKPAPHVIVISVDTLNRNALRSFEGSAPPLPVLDAFAEKSVRFVNAYSTASWTLPAHASLLTGLYPDRHGATRELQGMAIGVSTIAEALKSRGYQTVAFTGGGFLHAAYGFSRGFDRYDQRLAKGGGDRDSPARPRRIAESGARILRARHRLRLPAAIDAGPLFLFLHTYAVHDYYEQREWALARIGDLVAVHDPPYLTCLWGVRQCSPHDWDRLEALYRAELEHFDGGLGRLIAALERAQLWDRSVVFFVSDHGEGFDPEHRRIHHGGRLHADQLHIPLLVRVPGQAPRDETSPVSLVDLMPTILELTGTPPDGDLDGRSFAALLRGESRQKEARPLYAMEHHYVWSEEGVRMPGRRPGRYPYAVAVIEGPHWYIRSLWGEELYDTGTDQLQRQNLARQAADLDGYRELVARRPGRQQVAPNPIERDEELAAQLRSLGYTR